MTKANFTTTSRNPSINIADWQKKYPNYCAIVERDKEKPGYGWIRYRHVKPFHYSLDQLKKETDYSFELCCNPNDCYEIIPKDFVWKEKWGALSSKRMREITKLMNTKEKSIES